MTHAGEGASDQPAVRRAHHPDADVPEGERAQPQDRHLLRRRQKCQHATEDRQDGLSRTGGGQSCGDLRGGGAYRPRTGGRGQAR